MENLFYTLFQSLRIETDPVKKKATLIASLHCWVKQYQYLRFLSFNWTDIKNGKCEIEWRIPNSAASITPILWSGEYHIEIPFDIRDRPKTFSVHSFLKDDSSGGVTNTISNSGKMEME